MRPNAPNPGVLPFFAARPGLTFVGLTVVTFGTLATFQAFQRRAHAQPVPPPPPEPIPPRREDGLEDWERDALAGGEVEQDDHDHGHEEDPPEGLLQVGEGTPDELCHPVVQNNPEPKGDIELVCTIDPLADPTFAPRQSEAPMAEPGEGAIWPISKDSRHRRRLTVSYFTQDGIRGAWGRQFGGKRETDDGEVRRHAGIDLFANAGDVVVAPEGGRVVAILPFHHGSWALYLRVPGGRILNLGEIEKFSWREFGTRPGKQVKKGDPLARIALMRDGGHMLHYEMYAASDINDEPMTTAIRQGEMQWHGDGDPPPRLLDPSAYLVDAAARSYRTEKVVA